MGFNIDLTINNWDFSQNLIGISSPNLIVNALAQRKIMHGFYHQILVAFVQIFPHPFPGMVIQWECVPFCLPVKSGKLTQLWKPWPIYFDLHIQTGDFPWQ